MNPSKLDPMKVAERPVRRRRELGVRALAVIAALVVVLVATLLASAGLVYLLADELEASAETSAETRARDVAEVVSTIGITESAETLASGNRRGQVVQIIAPNGTVEQASSPTVATTPLVTLKPGPNAVASTEITGVAGEPGEWTVVARGVLTRGATYVVVVAVPIGVERAAIRSISTYLLVVAPVLLLLTGVVVWFLFGWGLGAVERIRRQVAGIDPRQLSRRVEVPGTKDEIAALAETMNEMLARLEKSDQTQRAFISDASHELRSPLASVVAAAELARSASGARRERLMSTIDLELLRIQSLVDNLMALARAEAPDSRQPREDIDLDDLLDEHRHRLAATSTRTVSTRLQPARIEGDLAALDRAIRNVIDNADRHARTAVRLTLAVEGGRARIWVDNDGALIEPADRERIFDRFVRLDESRSRDDGGSGLGLAIARATIEAHGGTLGVAEASDGWCRFEITLPVEVAESETKVEIKALSHRSAQMANAER